MTDAKHSNCKPSHSSQRRRHTRWAAPRPTPGKMQLRRVPYDPASARVCRTSVNDHFDNEAIQRPDAESLPRRIGTPASHFFDLAQRAVRIAPPTWCASVAACADRVALRAQNKRLPQPPRGIRASTLAPRHSGTMAPRHPAPRPPGTRHPGTLHVTQRRVPASGRPELRPHRQGSDGVPDFSSQRVGSRDPASLLSGVQSGGA